MQSPGSGATLQLSTATADASHASDVESLTGLYGNRQNELGSVMTTAIDTTAIDTFIPASAEVPSDKQRLFLRYFTAILIDLVVLNLFAEYSDRVYVSSFTISLLAAVLLQILLKLTLYVEHLVAGYFKGKPGGFMIFMRFFCAWVVLFGSKFVILEALALAFGDSVRFEGAFHGIVALIIVVVVMLVAEEAIVRFYRRLN
jgi:hypothetical protein